MCLGVTTQLRRHYLDGVGSRGETSQSLCPTPHRRFLHSEIPVTQCTPIRTTRPQGVRQSHANLQMTWRLSTLPGKEFAISSADEINWSPTQLISQEAPPFPHPGR
ncbi:hypothetical protein CDAR_558941 [Caerostris darwini]|uniref:Uncharacterized protein n=1 Tax=Caerostris darwini TaxID=1538125 RepID=A0AAV4NBD4_9ARAC|nr:hypothetical protein CDAR_558941 [Caerostris darwini]